MTRSMVNSLTEFIYQTVEKNFLVIYYLAKTFDSIFHKIFLKNLQSMGFERDLNLNWNHFHLRENYALKLESITQTRQQLTTESP